MNTMQFKLKRNLGKLKKGSIFTRYGVLVVHLDASFELETALRDKHTFEKIR